MPKKSIDFSQEVSGMRDPVSPDGRILIEAATIEAKGKAVVQESNMDLLKKGVNAGRDAAKGYLESGLESDIRKTVSSLETAQKYGEAVEKLSALDKDEKASPEDLRAAEKEIEGFRTALDQGVMTREQALLAIDKSVKEYSNILPGYASQLRKLATTVTGVEHMGNYAEYSALTKKTAAEKARELAIQNQAKLEQKAMEDFVDKYKRLPKGGINGPDMRMFQEEQKVVRQAELLKAQASVRDANVATVEPVVQQYVQTKLAGNILTLNQRLQGIVGNTDPTTGKMVSPENRILLRQQVLSDITTSFEQLKAEVLSFNSNQLSSSSRESMLSRLNTQQKELTDSLKNQDTFDDFKKTMELQSAQSKNVWDKFTLAHPHAIIMKNSGMVTPDTVKLWIDSQQDPRRSAEFRRIYGENLDNYYRSFATTNLGTGYANNAAEISRNPDHLGRIRDVDPAQYQAQLHTLRDSIISVATSGWGESPETQASRKASFGNWLKAFSTAVDPAREDTVREWSKLMSNPQVAQRIKELPQQAQLEAVEPVFTKTRQLLEDPTTGLLKRLSDLQAKSKDTFMGSGRDAFEVVLNPITKQFQVASATGKSPKNPRVFTDSTEGGAAGLLFSSGGQQITDGRNLFGGEVQRVLDSINRNLTALDNFKDIKGLLPKDLAESGIRGEYFMMYSTGFFGKTPEEKEQILGKVKTPTGSWKTEAAIRGQATDVPPETPKPFHLDELNKELARKDIKPAVRAILEKEKTRLEAELGQNK